MADMKRQPAAVARLVRQEREVVARGAERRHTRSQHDMPPVGRTLFHMRFGGERLQLVHLLGSHRVDLLKRYDDVLGEHDIVVLGEHIPVVLRGVVVAQQGRKDIEHERRLIRALLADEGEYLVVHHLGIHHRCHHRQEPAAGVEIKRLI